MKLGICKAVTESNMSQNQISTKFDNACMQEKDEIGRKFVESCLFVVGRLHKNSRNHNGGNCNRNGVNLASFEGTCGRCVTFFSNTPVQLNTYRYR